MMPEMAKMILDMAMSIVYAGIFLVVLYTVYDVVQTLKQWKEEER